MTVHAQSNSEVSDPTQFSIDLRIRRDAEGFNPYGSIYFSRKHDSLNTECFALVNAGSYAEILCGISVVVNRNSSLAFGIGFDSTGNPWRTYVGFYYNPSEFLSALVYIEYGRAGVWHSASVEYWPLNNLAIGVMSQRFDGEGLRLQYKREAFTPYAALLFNTEAYIAGRNGLRGYGVAQLGIRFQL